ncbi:sugar-binding transcriptional regulator [Sporosarcina sp. G11-34]|uniref:sugar-binding transcriptional regulator n=1 Tax=Sporosarcina sp. G11-34 TaxID=2849605 RepID=UPI0022A9A3E6|nr:sugar-binding transcriptional regulator [Sporosarcina sp. G11-34]MCZ2258099.1 sugar-binding transcriptional regulator [Sporosarcina sp. G11-34]
MVDETKTLLKIAYYYYKDGLTQQEIAKKLSVSRQKVNRCIKRLLAEGLVTIEIAKIEGSYEEMENYLERLLGLKRVVIAHVENEQSIIEQIGKAGAQYVMENMANGLRVGVSWGKTLHRVGGYLSDKRKENVEVIQLIGGVNSIIVADMTNEITRLFATGLQAIPHYIHAPAIVKNKKLRESILKEESIRIVLEKIDECHMAVVGIGELGSDSTIYGQSYVDQAHSNYLHDQKAVGDICLHMFDKQGRFIGEDMDHYSIGVGLDQLMNIPQVIAVAGGVEKVSAILGAIRTGVIDVLVTDSISASLLCKAVNSKGVN